MAFELDSEKLLTKRNLIIAGVVVALLFILIIAGSILGNKTSPMEPVYRLNARITNLSKTIKNYSKQLKSSDLRGMASTLSTTVNSVSSTMKAVTGSEEYKEALEKGRQTEIASEETAIITELNEKLENARLNAALDRTFANEMANQIYLLQQLEAECRDTTENEEFKASLGSSIDNLNALYPQFQDFK